MFTQVSQDKAKDLKARKINKVSYDTIYKTVLRLDINGKRHNIFRINGHSNY